MARDQTSTTAESTAPSAQEKIYVASQTQLMWWKFRKHRMAVISVALVALLYLLAIFADFIAPYDPNETDTEFLFVPPRRIHFVGPDGFSLRPFVYGLNLSIDDETYRKTYTDDESVQYPIHFFVHGSSYEMWGLIESDLHLFGLREGKGVFLLGTDIRGRDQLSRIVMGSRISLTLGLVGVAISVFLGSLIGTLSGYFGGLLDDVIQRVIEFIRSFPTLPLWMALSAALPPTWPSHLVYLGIVVVLSFIGWTSLAREVRGKILSLRETDFVLAAQATGASTARLIFVHMMPTMTSHILVVATLSIPGMILGESTLSFLGLGIKPPLTSWGLLLSQAIRIEVMRLYPWMLSPGIFIAVVVLTFNFLGDGLRDAVDPFA